MPNDMAAYAYDRLGRLVNVHFPDGSMIAYNYDAMGNRTSVVQTAAPSPPPCCPPTVSALPKVQQGDFNNSGMVVLLSTGEFVGWGDNTTASLANGNSGASNSPSQRVLFDPNTTMPPFDATIADWAFTNANLYIVFSNGWVYSAGKNDFGQTGHGDAVGIVRAQLKRIDSFVAQNISITKVWASGAHDTTSGGGCAYFLSSAGAMYGCGQNSSGNLGTNSTANQPAPVACMKTGSISITGLSQQSEVAIACVNTSFSAYIYDPTTSIFFVAGKNANGQLGDGTTADKLLFTNVSVSASNVKKIVANGGVSGASSGGNAFLLDSAGKLWSTGYNGHGELGNGNTTNRSSFGAVTNLSSNVSDFAFGGGFFGYGIAWLSTGTVYSWGYNGQNNLFLNNSTTPQSTPTVVTSLPGTISKAFLPKGNNLGTNAQLFLLTTTGAVAYAGSDNGQTGIGNTAFPGAYKLLPNLRFIRDGSETVADVFVHGTGTAQRLFVLTNLGNLYAAGSNIDSICTRGVASDVAAANTDWSLITFSN